MQIKFCSMHSLNLGYGLWLAGGAILYLTEEMHLWGENDRPLEERLHDAWMTFNNWAKQKKIKYFDRMKDQPQVPIQLFFILTQGCNG